MFKRGIKKVGTSILISVLLIQTLGAKPIQFSTDRLVDVQTQVQKGATLVELKTVGQMMDLEVIWNAADKSIKLQDVGNTLTLYVGKSKGSFNGKSLEIGAVPIVVEGRTYIPLRIVAEQFGYKLISDKESIILSRKIAENEKETLKLWEDKRSYYRGLIYAILNHELEGYSLDEIPIQEARKDILEDIKSIKITIEKTKASTLVKVLGQEYISTLKAIDALYAIEPSKKADFKKAYHIAVYKSDYLECEYKDLENNRHSEVLIEPDFTNPQYDEVKVSVGYTYMYQVLRDRVEDVNEAYKGKNVYMDQISYTISTAVTQRENLKYMRGALRSQDAKETFDAYIAYADLVITYYCEVRRNLKEPEKVNKQYEAALSKAKAQVEVAYNKYISFGETNK